MSQENTENIEKEILQDENTTENQDVQENNEPEVSVEDQLQEQKDKFIRLYAEFENYKRRSEKERVSWITNSQAGVLGDLLEVVDDFERAMNAMNEAKEVGAVKEGVELIFTKLKNNLQSHRQGRLKVHYLRHAGSCPVRPLFRGLSLRRFVVYQSLNRYRQRRTCRSCVPYLIRPEILH